MLCPRLVPKDIPRNHPCHIDDTDDDCSQKVQCGKNNIQNIHDGIPPLGISCVYIRNRQEDDKKLNFLLTRHNVTRGREHDRCTCRQHLSSTKYHKMWQNAMLSETYIKTRSPFGIGRTRGASRCSLMAILHKRYINMQLFEKSQAFSSSFFFFIMYASIFGSAQPSRLV